MTAFERTDDVHFEALADWPYPPRYHSFEDLRVHYVDHGPADGPVVLLTHGMPTWGYLYRTMIPGLVAAGYRCIAPDHLGFGRSDKPTDRGWYSIARHSEAARIVDHRARSPRRDAGVSGLGRPDRPRPGRDDAGALHSADHHEHVVAPPGVRVHGGDPHVDRCVARRRPVRSCEPRRRDRPAPQRRGGRPR